MRLINSRFLAATTLTLLTLPQLTWAWTKDYSYEHKMGDNDSRNLAKEAAVEQIKLKAAQEAGTYIQGTTTLSNGQLEETITQIGASIVKVVVQSDKISVDDTGHQLLTVTANATVDETVMQERIKALREDANKAKLLQQLASENEKLRAEMTALAKQRVQELDSDKLAAIVAREATLRKDLATNFTSTEQVFQSVVTAIDVANQQALALKSEFDKIAAEWELNFFQPLREPKILKAEVVDMRLSDNGGYYIGKIVIEWQDNPNGEIEKFICQQRNDICKKKIYFERELLKNHLLFTFPPSMSEQNQNRFRKMISSKNHSKTYRTTPSYVIKANLAGKSVTIKPPRIWTGTIGTELGRFGEYFYQSEGSGYSIPPNYFIVPIGTYQREVPFQVSIDAMKANPLLKVEIDTKDQKE